MSKLTYADRLSKAERGRLRTMVATGERPARDVRRANVILLSDAGRSRTEICELLAVAAATVDRARQRWANEGIEAATSDRPRSGRPSTLTPRDEAKIVALACTPAPTGSRRWAHRALTAALRKQRMLSHSVGRETVRQVLARHGLKPWKKGSTGASLN